MALSRTLYVQHRRSYTGARGGTSSGVMVRYSCKWINSLFAKGIDGPSRLVASLLRIGWNDIDELAVRDQKNNSLLISVCSFSIGTIEFASAFWSVCQKLETKACMGRHLLLRCCNRRTLCFAPAETRIPFVKQEMLQYPARVATIC